MRSKEGKLRFDEMNRENSGLLCRGLICCQFSNSPNGMQQNENLDGCRGRLNPVKSHGKSFFLEDDTSLSGLQLQTPSKCKLHLTSPLCSLPHEELLPCLEQYACSSRDSFSLSKLAPHGVFPNPTPRILDCTRVYPLKVKAT
jgi:hypothetical protein